MGFYVPESCKCCGRYDRDHMHVVKINDMRMVLCKNCLKRLRDEIDHEVTGSVRPGDTVWIADVMSSVRRCEAIPMTVKSVYPNGNVHEINGSRKISYNIYAEKDDGSRIIYLKLNNRNKTWFMTKEAADAAIEERIKKVK